MPVDEEPVDPDDPVVVSDEDGACRGGVVGAVFLAGADFAAVDFFAGADLLAAVFLAGADLLAAVFFAGADLLAAVFLAGADLLAAVFFAGADLLAVDFLAGADLLAVDFLAGADLLAVDFLAGADLLAAVFLAGADLLAVDFLAGADLLAADFFAGAVSVPPVAGSAVSGADSPRTAPAAARAAEDAARVAVSATWAAWAGTTESDSAARLRIFLTPATTSRNSSVGSKVGTTLFLDFLPFLSVFSVCWENTPNLLITTFSPAARDLVMESTTASKACCATSRFPSKRSAIRSISFFFPTVAPYRSHSVLDAG
nr:hypothetical protein [Phytoactinopolyspora halotolerans]